MILILSNSNDPHAQHVAQRLKQRDAKYIWLDHQRFPSEARISLSLSPSGHSTRTYRLGDTVVDLGSIDVAWYRRPAMPTPDPSLEEARRRKYVIEESKVFLQDLWNSLDCCWVPAPHPVFRRAEMKLSQLHAATAVGMEIPETLITNRPEDLLKFYRTHNARIISKLPSNVFAREIFGDDFVRYTEFISHRDIGYAQAARYSPMIFQAYVPKRLELRITVVGRRVFAAEIHSPTARAISGLEH